MWRYTEFIFTRLNLGENDNTTFSDFIDNNELQTRISNKM